MLYALHLCLGCCYISELKKELYSDSAYSNSTLAEEVFVGIPIARKVSLVERL